MISLKSVSKSFGSQNVLDKVSFDISEGEKICIIGMSGSGKSVLMKLMTGLLKVDSGEIFIGDQDVTHFSEKEWSPILNKFGVVFQGAALFDSLSVLENVGIKMIEDRSIAKSEIRERVVASLKKVGLKPEEVLSKYPAELSGGMKKRVGIARAIVHEPEVVFYDEPTTGLDPVNANRIDELISSLSEEKGRTSVIITHDMVTVEKIASRVVFLDDKHIRFNGSPGELFSSKDPVVMEFVKREKEK